MFAWSKEEDPELTSLNDIEKVARVTLNTKVQAESPQKKKDRQEGTMIERKEWTETRKE
jgi:hypothetical protein